MSDDSRAKKEIKVSVSSETIEHIGFMSKALNLSLEATAAKLLAHQAEAETGLLRGPFLRKYMYRVG
jgi:hypothetical protein